MRMIFSKWRSLFHFNLASVFSMDVRSLALVRILVGILILLDLFSRSFDITFFYGDHGVLPSSLLHAFSSGKWAWSLHLLDGGSTPLLSSLFILNAIAALALLLGYKTRYAAIATWILTVSLHNANVLALQGGDVLLRGILFVGMFLPWGEVFSLDRIFAKTKPAHTTVFSGWTIAFLLQIAFMYYFASFFKDSVEWNNGTAIYYTLSIDQYATSVAHFLLRFPEFLKYLTHTIHWYQHIALFLLFSPILTKYIRTTTAISLMLMHLAFAICMHLGMFSWIAMTALVGFIPGDVWNWIARAVRPRFKVLAGYLDLSLPAAFTTTKGEHATFVRNSVTAFISTLGIIYILYLFVWQASEVVTLRNPPDWPAWQIPAHVLRLDQRWNLFAPEPYKDDGWFVIAGTLASGEKVDLYYLHKHPDGDPLSFQRPNNLFEVYPSTRWRKYGIEIRKNDSNMRFRPYYADYFCRKWNDTHESEQRLDSVEIVYIREETPPPGISAQPDERLSLLSWRCGDIPR